MLKVESEKTPYCLIRRVYQTCLNAFNFTLLTSQIKPYICALINQINLRFNIIQVMYLSSEAKAEIFAKHGKSATDTGSAEGQVALFTTRIAHLTGHLKKNKHDFSTQLSLQKLVGKRRALLAYLFKKDIERYRAIIKALQLRDIIK